MVFALETFWPASDGWSAARIEEEVVVTADGCEVITRYPAEDLLVAGKPIYTVGGPLPPERETQSNLNTRARRRRAGGRSGQRPDAGRRSGSALAGVRAAVVEDMGRPPAPAELPEPQRRPGEALVRISAAALNPVELHIWNGHFFDGPPRPPYVIGLEGVGVVEEGERLAPGTRVRVEFVHPGYGRNGAVAEYAVAPEEPDASDRASQASVTADRGRARRHRRRRARRAGVHGAHVRRARAAGGCLARRRARARNRRDRRGGPDRHPACQADGSGARGGGRT